MNERAASTNITAIGRFSALSTLWIVAAVLATSSIATAQEPRKPTIEGLRVGFGDSNTNTALGDSMTKYKTGCWTPVEITFQGGTDPITGTVELYVPDADGAMCRMVSPRPVQLLPGKRTKVQMYGKFGSQQADVRIKFLDERRKAVINRVVSSNNTMGDSLNVPWAMQPGERLVVAIGPSLGIEQAALLHQSSGGEAISVAQIGDVASLPTEWYGYDGVDTVVITTSAPEMFTKLLDTGARVAALEKWIELGGKLVLAVGSQAPTVLAPDAVLSKFAPGRFVEPTTLKLTVALETYVGGGRKVPRPAGRDLALSVPRLENVEGVTVVAEADLPLVVRTPRRFGQITFVAFDLDRQPFIDWDGRGLMASRLLGLTDPSSTDQTGAMNVRNRWMQDLASQMQSGLDQFSGVTRIPFALVALLILGYIALIGPGDYFLVKRVLKRMELTWITFPLWVVLVSGGAYLLARYTKGNDLRLNQVDLIDVDTTTGMTRATSWLNLFSPQSRTFNLSLIAKQPSGTDAPQADRLFAWSGSVNRPYGGGGGGSMFAGEYEFAPQLDGVKDAPIQVWSTKGFLGRSSYASAASVTADLTRDTSRAPTGTIQNGLAEPLTDCMLLSDRWAFVLGTIQPGQSVELKPGERRDLQQVLRNPSNMDSTIHYQTPRMYRGANSNVNVLQTLQSMMFFKASEGTLHNWSNDMESLLDLSDLLTLDRAILVGRGTRSAAQLASDGEPLTVPAENHWVVYRFVFPVKPAAKAEHEKSAERE